MALNFQAQYNLHDQHKLGLNYWYGEANNYKKIKLGLQAVLGWSEKFYTLTEFDHLWSKDNKDFETKSLFELLKIGYEFYKGLHFQAVQEWGKIDAASSTETQSLGAGFLWYPRPHFELESLWSKRKIIAKTDLSEDYAYLLLHFYF